MLEAPQGLVGRPRKKTLRGQVVSVVASKGGVGKTTLGIWLAQSMRDAGYRVAMVDGNVAQPDLLKRLQAWSESTLGLMHLVGEPGHRYAPEDLEDAVIAIPGFVDVLPGPPTATEAPQLEALIALRQAIEDLRESYDWIVLDTPVATVYERVMSKVVGPCSDAMLLVLTADRATIHDAHNWLAAAALPVERSGLDLDLSRIVGVVNENTYDNRITLEKLQGWIPTVPLQGAIPAIPDMVYTNNDGIWRCPDDAKQAIANITHSLCGTSPAASDKSAGQKKKKLWGRKKKGS